MPFNFLHLHFKFTMIAAIVFLASVVCFTAEARNKILIFTSVYEAPETSVWSRFGSFQDPYRTSLWKEIEESFLQQLSPLGERFEIQIRHQVDANLLWQALQDPEVAGLVWISHANSKRENVKPGLRADSVILTDSGQNVLSLFQKPHPTMKFLAIIGCRAESVVREFREKYYRDNNPFLQVVSADDKIIVNEGVAKVIAELLHVDWNFDRSAISPQPPSKQHLVIRRSWNPPQSDSGLLLDSAQVTLNNVFLGMLPKLRPGETRETEFELPDQTSDSRQPWLKISSGYMQANVDHKIPLGEITIREVGVNSQIWEPFVDANGAKISVGYELYRRNGQNSKSAR